MENCVGSISEGGLRGCFIGFVVFTLWIPQHRNHLIHVKAYF